MTTPSSVPSFLLPLLIEAALEVYEAAMLPKVWRARFVADAGCDGCASLACLLLPPPPYGVVGVLGVVVGGLPAEGAEVSTATLLLFPRRRRMLAF